MAKMSPTDPVDAVTEQTASGMIAEIFVDIRQTLDVEVVNLIWRHLATMPGGLEWVWSSLKPLYEGAAIAPAANIRRHMSLPRVSVISHDTLRVAGIDGEALAGIGAILDSYQHTNALALVCFSAFLTRFENEASGPEPTASGNAETTDFYKPPGRLKLPRLIPLDEMPTSLANLIRELNGFGEDADPTLTASMYRHLAHWPTYLALVRTLLAPLQASGELGSLVEATRRLGYDAGKQLAGGISAAPLPQPIEPILGAVRRFAHHPIARMTGICSLIRLATPR